MLRQDGAASSQRLPTVVDFFANQGAWWCCVLLALGAVSPDVNQATYLALTALAPAAYLATHLVFDADRRAVASLFLLGAILGWAGDTFLLRAGFISFPSAPGAGSSPLFMFALWAMFAVSLRASGRVFVNLRPWLRVAVASAAGPVAYLGGERLGVLDVAPFGVFGVALVWAVVAPLLALAAQRLEVSSGQRSLAAQAQGANPSPEGSSP